MIPGNTHRSKTNMTLMRVLMLEPSYQDDVIQDDVSGLKQNKAVNTKLISCLEYWYCLTILMWHENKKKSLNLINHIKTYLQI